MKLKAGNRVKCPLCGKWDDVGVQGPGKYFCADCCVEFVYKKKHIEVFNITTSGAAVLFKKIEIKE